MHAIELQDWIAMATVPLHTALVGLHMEARVSSDIAAVSLHT